MGRRTLRANQTRREKDLRGFFPQYQYQSGRWYGGHGSANSTTSNTMAADRIYFSPMVFLTNHTFTDVGINVATAGAAGTLIRLGLYLDDGAGQPGALVSDYGTVLVDTTGEKIITSIAEKVKAGVFYWRAFISDGTPNVRSVNITDAVNSAGGLNMSTPYGGWRQNFTFAALPDPAVPVVFNGNNDPRISSAPMFKA